MARGPRFERAFIILTVIGTAAVFVPKLKLWEPKRQASCTSTPPDPLRACGPSLSCGNDDTTDEFRFIDASTRTRWVCLRVVGTGNSATLEVIDLRDNMPLRADVLYPEYDPSVKRSVTVQLDRAQRTAIFGLFAKRLPPSSTGEGGLPWVEVRLGLDSFWWHGPSPVDPFFDEAVAAFRRLEGLVPPPAPTK